MGLASAEPQITSMMILFFQAAPLPPLWGGIHVQTDVSAHLQAECYFKALRAVRP